MNSEIVFILEPDTGRITVESSNASADVVSEIKRDLGEPATLNCARPLSLGETNIAEDLQKGSVVKEVITSEFVYLFRLYHYSTVDGPGRRSVVQFAGCSIRCPGCFMFPETHKREEW